MKYKNYLFVSPTAVLGGAERVMFNLMFSLLQEGHVVIFICMSRGKQLGWDELLKYENFHPYFKKYSSDVEYAKIERQARKSKVGLWQEKNPIAPWDWRKK